MSPQPAPTLHYAAFTHQGKGFERNQDAILVADAEIASRIAVHGLPASTRRLFDAVMAKSAPDDASGVLLARETR